MIRLILTTFLITGYCNLSCGKDADHPAFGIMANGERTHWGAVACPIEYPFGTRIWLGGEWFVCEDRGGGIVWDEECGCFKIDVWFETCDQANDFGVKLVTGAVER